MFYRKFEISQSLNGVKLMFIARNPAGIVVLRETSENRLKNAIDKYILHLEGLHEKEGTINKNKKSTKPKKVEELSKEELDKELEVLLPPLKKDIRRGPGGKFISRSQIETSEVKEEEENAKKSFWQKLTKN